MSDLDLDTIRSAAVVAAGVFAALALLAGILLKSLAQKAAFLAIFGLVALLIWTQRQSLEDCATVVQAALTEDGPQATCSFFGISVNIPVDIPQVG